MARMLSAHAQQFHLSDAVACARQVADAQVELLARAARQVLQAMPVPPAVVILSGHGDYVARRLLAAIDWPGELFLLVDQLGPLVARCAPAHALAVLAQEAAQGA
jgi:uncharacterized hydantoinase/oxoprolinase family protein